MCLFLPKGRVLAAAPGAASQPQVSPGRGLRPRWAGVRDFLSGRGAEGSRRQPGPPPPLPLGGGVSQPGGGRRAGLGFLSEDAQGSGRRSVCECVSVCRSHGVCLRPRVPPPPLPPLLTVEVNVKQQLQPRDKHGDVSA